MSAKSLILALGLKPTRKPKESKERDDDDSVEDMESPDDEGHEDDARDAAQGILDAIEARDADALVEALKLFRLCEED